MPVIDLGRVIGPQGPQGETGAQGIRGEQGLPGPNQVTNSTATPLTGVLTGNGSVVGIRSIDATPTANSEGIPTSGGTDKAIKARMPVYGMGKNLLDNWYFGNPVNQRGVSSYSAAGYAIDRWKIANATTVMTITNQYVRIKASTNGSQAIVDQYINAPEALLGKTLTVSAWLSTGLETHTFTMPSSYSSGYIMSGIRVFVGADSNGEVYVRLVHSNTWDLYLYAVKLELGTEQTLCHNEGTAESPVWVLNEIPDYGEELRKCQRYLHILKCTTGSWYKIGIVGAYSATVGMAFIPLPTTMRAATPTISYNYLVLQNGSSSIPITGATFRGMGPNAIYIEIAVTGLTAGNTYILAADTANSGWLTISCEP